MALDFSSRRRGVRFWATGFLLAMVIVFNSGYALRVTEQGNRMTFPGLIASLVFVAVALPRRRPSRMLLLGYVVLGVAMILSLIANYSYSAALNTAALFAVVTLAYLIAVRLAFGEFVEFYILLMKILTSVALVVYVVVNVLGITLRLPVVYNWDGFALLNGLVFFLHQHPLASSPILGPFWEPGLFASFIAMAAMAETSLVQRRYSKWTLAVFSLGLMATHTSAGVVLLFLLAALYLARRLHRFAMLFSLVATVVVITAMAYSGPIVEVALRSQWPLVADIFDANDPSLENRLYSPVVNMKVYEQSPIFGVSLGRVGLLYADYSRAYRSTRSQTSTSTYMIAVLGVLGAAYTVFWILGILGARVLRPPERVLVLTLFLLIVNKEPHAMLLITYCFLFYFLQSPRASRPARRQTTTGVSVPLHVSPEK